MTDFDCVTGMSSCLPILIVYHPRMRFLIVCAVSEIQNAALDCVCLPSYQSASIMSDVS